MRTNLNYQFIDEESAQNLLFQYKDQMLENAKLLVVTDEKLSIVGTELHYAATVEGEKQKGSIDLANTWVPGAVGWQHPIPILLHKDYAKALIEVVDKFANKAKHNISFAKTGVIAQFNIAAQFIEYLCLNGNIHLEDINNKQIEELLEKLKVGGITKMLNISERVELFIDSLIENDELEPFLRRDDERRKARVKGLKVLKLAQCIGSVSLNQHLSNNIYQKVAKYLKSKNILVKKGFTTKGILESGQPSSKSFGNWFSIWNKFAKLDSDDHLQFIPFPNPSRLSKKHGKTASRTKNLDLEDVVNLLGESHKWLYEASNKIISLIKEIKIHKDKLLTDGLNHQYIQRELLPEFLLNSKKVNELEKLLSITIHRSSLMSSTNNPSAYSLTEVVTMLVSSCYVVLQTYNARRKAEIQDPLIGIQEQYFRCKSKKYNWYQASFYNEKNNERRWYTLNNGSTKAIRCLINLKNSWRGNDADGLFVVPNFGVNEQGGFKHFKFNFNKGKDSKISGNMFLEMALGRSDVDTGSQPFRRIYAIIFHYQYKNADLLALCHQLGHVDPDHTVVYVTEPASRDQHEQLHNKVKLTKNEKNESTIAIKEENKALDKVIEEVGIETTAKDILCLLMGTEKMAGKYTAYLKKVYRVLQNSIRFNSYTSDTYGKEFVDLTPEEKSGEMAKVLDARGHKHRPKPHASCHRKPGDAKKHKGPCEPTECAGCPYQEVKKVQLDIMKADLAELKTKQSDFSMLLIERMRDKEQITNLTILIEGYERSMRKNESLFSSGVKK
ncbi:hypothetical protein GCM10009111_10970 [Colwellia asteriadis]|uniref:Tyr recombinase domain-containing protein n=1 Tax=Colwellia asteriadis TaxID=517723 RepID=A0ABN1L4Z1_9GAMM